MDIITIFMVFMVLACGYIKNKTVYIITVLLGTIELVGGIYLKFTGFAESTTLEAVGLLSIIAPVIMLSQKHEDTKEN